MIGWGIGIVLAFLLGVIVGAITLGAFAVKIALKAKAGSDPDKLEEMRERADKNWKHIQERIERIKKMRVEIDGMKKTAPKPIPSIRSMKCDDCGHEWRSMSIISECPGCGSRSTRMTGTVTETPFIGEPS